MTRAPRDAGVIVFAVVAVLGLAALLLAAATDQRRNAFSLEVPNAAPFLSLDRRQVACEGPIETTVAFGAVQAYLIPAATPGAGVDLTVRGARSGVTLATGREAPGYSVPTIANIALNSTVPAGSRVAVCFRSEGPQRVSLLGSGRVNPAVTVTLDGKPTIDDVALVFLRPHPRSLLSLIPTVFDRAALFRPGWVGSWTFWLLSGGLLITFVLGGIAVAQAERSDGCSSERTTDQ